MGGKDDLFVDIATLGFCASPGLQAFFEVFVGDPLRDGKHRRGDGLSKLFRMVLGVLLGE